MLTTVPAHEVQVGSEHVAEFDSGLSRRMTRRCSCLRCNPHNGSFYARCRLRNPHLDAPESPAPNPLDVVLDDSLMAARNLSPQEKAQVWQYIQKNDSNLVAFLKDPAIVQFVKAGASPLFPTDLVERALGYIPG